MPEDFEDIEDFIPWTTEYERQRGLMPGGKRPRLPAPTQLDFYFASGADKHGIYDLDEDDML